MTCLEHWHHWNVVSTVQGKHGVTTTEQCCRCLTMRSYERWTEYSAPTTTQIEVEKPEGK